MFFNSINFAIFLPVVFTLYWFVADKNLKAQNTLLLIASYFFYACWDYRFLFLLMFSTFLDYAAGIKMFEASSLKRKKTWLWASIIINVGFLGFFKYYNFFAVSFAEAASHLGLTLSPWALKIILPVGISFYTFHGLSYVIDIYNNKIKPERNFIDYAVFVSFFPLLVAGPIERATHLLPQIKRERAFDYVKATDGLRQILWGLFKKIVIADSCATYANQIFNNGNAYSGSTHFLGAVFFAFQIYCDFSGYSDIAIGVARLFGIELLRNFAFPYFSRDIAEFWRRWHISLSSWFRDYLYIPLGGNKGSTWIKTRNIFIIFIVSGFWHGANWTFIIWGLLNAIYFLPLLFLKKNRINMTTVAAGKYLPSAREFFNMLKTFILTVFAWIFFRSESVSEAIKFTAKIFTTSSFTIPTILPIPLFILLGAFLIIEWLGREQQYAIAALGLKWPKIIRYGFYYSLIISMLMIGSPDQPFIYFQF